MQTCVFLKGLAWSGLSFEPTISHIGSRWSLRNPSMYEMMAWCDRLVIILENQYEFSFIYLFVDGIFHFELFNIVSEKWLVIFNVQFHFTLLCFCHKLQIYTSIYVYICIMHLCMTGLCSYCFLLDLKIERSIFYWLSTRNCKWYMFVLWNARLMEIYLLSPFVKSSFQGP